MDARTRAKIRAFVLEGREEPAPATGPVASPPAVERAQAAERASVELEVASVADQVPAEPEVVTAAEQAFGEPELAQAVEQGPAESVIDGDVNGSEDGGAA
jgi:hypothetical protein